MLKWRIIWREESYRWRFYFPAVKERHDLVVRGDLTYSGSYKVKNAAKHKVSDSAWSCWVFIAEERNRGTFSVWLWLLKWICWLWPRTHEASWFSRKKGEKTSQQRHNRSLEKANFKTLRIGMLDYKRQIWIWKKGRLRRVQNYLMTLYWGHINIFQCRKLDQKFHKQAPWRNHKFFNCTKLKHKVQTSLVY